MNEKNWRGKDGLTKGPQKRWEMKGGLLDEEVECLLLNGLRSVRFVKERWRMGESKE